MSGGKKISLPIACLLSDEQPLSSSSRQPILSLCQFRDKSRITLKGGKGTIVSWPREFY